MTHGQTQAEQPVNAAALKVLEKYAGKHGQRALALIAAAQVLTPAAQKARAYLKKREDYTITVVGTDDIYPDLHEWVLARIPEPDRKALIATTNTSKFIEIGSDDPPPRVRLRYDGSRTQSVILDGHKVTVEVTRDDLPGGREHLPENWRVLMESIKFTSASPGGRDAVTRMIEGLVTAKHSKPGPPLYIPSRWGGSWNKRNDLPPRMLDSIILKAGQLEHLVTDLDTFLKAESEYARMSQPWHRGYLFHGAPGTGKTSVARALADHFDMPVHYLPLGDLEKDADLMSLVGAIESKSILLLEDIDVYSAATERSDTNNKSSIAAMLNALDGVWTPHGLVTIMTTNDRDALDPALLRAGRVDMDEEFTVLDIEQAERLWAYITGEKADFTVTTYQGRSPVELISAARNYQTDRSLTHETSNC